MFLIVTFTNQNPFYNRNNSWSLDILLKTGFTVVVVIIIIIIIIIIISQLVYNIGPDEMRCDAMR